MKDYYHLPQICETLRCTWWKFLTRSGYFQCDVIRQDDVCTLKVKFNVLHELCIVLCRKCLNVSWKKKVWRNHILKVVYWIDDRDTMAKRNKIKRQIIKNKTQHWAARIPSEMFVIQIFRHCTHFMMATAKPSWRLHLNHWEHLAQFT